MKVAYLWNGRPVSRRVFMRRKLKAAKPGVPQIARGATQDRPQLSIGLGVPRFQVDEFNAFYASAGITGAYHRPDGTCVIESRKARNQLLKLRGMRDNDAGYGDHAGYN